MILSLKLLEEGSLLNAPKYRPNVVVIQGKIYVFPTSFSPWKEHVSAPRFEVLNGESGSVLPEPFDDDPEFWCVGKDDRFKVEAYLVHDDSKLILSTPKGICMFNVTEPRAAWKHVDGHLPFSKEGVLVDSDGCLCFGVLRDHPNDLLMSACILSKDDGLGNPINIAYDKYAKTLRQEQSMVGKDYRLCLAPLVAGFRFGLKFSVHDYDIDDDDGGCDEDDGNKICCVRSGCDSDCHEASILVDIFTIQEFHWMREE